MPATALQVTVMPSGVRWMERTGGVVSRMETVNVQVAELVAESLAVQVTVLTPC